MIDLQLTAKISELTATIFNLDDLFVQIADALKTDLQLVDAQIYILEEHEHAPPSIKQMAGRSLTDLENAIGGGMFEPEFHPVWSLYRTREPVIWPDLSAQPQAEHLGAQSGVTIALLILDQMIGALTLYSANPNAFTRQDLPGLYAIAAQVVVAVQNNRLLTDIEAQAERAVLLNQMGEALSGITDLDGIYKVVSDYAPQVIPSDRICVTFLDRGQSQLTIFTLRQGRVQSPLGTMLPVTGTAAGQVLKSQTLLNVPDLANAQFTDAQRLAEQGFASAMFVPMTIGSETIGTLNISNRLPNAFSSRDESLAQNIAGFVVSTVENRRLFAQIQTALAETELLYEASTALNLAQTYTDVLAVLQRYTIFGHQPTFAGLYFFEPSLSASSQPQRVQTLAQTAEAPLVWANQDAVAVANLLRLDKLTVLDDLQATLTPAVLKTEAQATSSGMAVMVSLVVGRRCIGFALARFDQAPQITDTENRQAMAVANWSAVTVQSLHNLQLAEQQTQELEIVNRVLSQATRGLSLDELLENVYRQLSEAFPTEVFFVGLLNPDTQQITYPFAYANGKRQEKAPHPLAYDSQLAQVVGQAQPTLITSTPSNIPTTTQTVGSLMFTPLAVGETVMGVLSVQSYDPQAYTARDLRILQTIAQQIATTIQNAQLFDQTRQALERLEATQRRYTLQSWENYRSTHQVSQFSYHRPGLAGMDPALIQVASQAVDNKAPVLFGSATKADIDLGSGMMTPLLLRDEVIGVVGLQDLDPNRHWQMEEIALVKAVVLQIVQAAEELRLLEETQRRAAREQKTRDIADKIRAAPNVEAIIQTGLTELSTALNASRTYVRLTSEIETKE